MSYTLLGLLLAKVSGADALFDEDIEKAIYNFVYKEIAEYLEAEAEDYHRKLPNPSEYETGVYRGIRHAATLLRMKVDE